MDYNAQISNYNNATLNLVTVIGPAMMHLENYCPPVSLTNETSLTGSNLESLASVWLFSNDTFCYPIVMSLTFYSTTP